MNDIDAVWTVPNALAAAVAGGLYLPIFVASFLRLRLNHSRAGYALLVGVNVLCGTFLFAVAESVAGISNHDPLWFRIFSRWFLYLPFAAALTLGLLIVTRRSR